jgi:hypothetical protein
VQSINLPQRPSRAKKRKRERDAKQHVVSVPCSTAGKAAVNNSVAKKAGHGFHNQDHNLHQDHVFEPHSKIKPRNACPLGTEHPFAVTEGESLSCVWLARICYEEVLQPVIGLCKGNLLSKIQMETVAHAAVTFRKWLPGIQEVRVAFHIGDGTGVGKTWCILALVILLEKTREVNRVVFLSPSTGLKKQLETALGKLGAPVSWMLEDSIKGTNTMRIQCTNEGNTQEPAEIGNGSSCPVDIGATNSNATDASGEDSDDPTYQARARKVSKKSKARKRPEEVKHGSVCFLLWNFVRRTNEKWKQYMKKDPEKKGSHVKKESPFWKLGFAMVTLFIIDVMHTFDYGTLQTYFVLLWTGIHSMRTAEGQAFRRGLKMYTEWAARYVTADLTRKLKGLEFYPKFKMRESRNWATYLLLPTIYLMKKHLPIEQRENDYEAVKKLARGIRLVAGFSASPVNEDNRRKAQSLFDDFAEYLVGRCGVDCMTYKNHKILHITEDMERYKCHFDHLTAYQFENMHSIWNYLVHKGPQMHIQLLNSLVQRYTYRLPSTNKKGLTRTSPTKLELQQLLQFKLHEWTTEIIPTAPLSLRTLRKNWSNPSAAVQELTFASFTARNTFPNNVLLLKGGGSL